MEAAALLAKKHALETRTTKASANRQERETAAIMKAAAMANPSHAQWEIDALAAQEAEAQRAADNLRHAKAEASKEATLNEKVGLQPPLGACGPAAFPWGQSAFSM